MACLKFIDLELWILIRRFSSLSIHSIYLFAIMVHESREMGLISVPRADDQINNNRDLIRTYSTYSISLSQ